MNALHTNIKTHADAIIYFFTQLDLDMIDKLLDQNKGYMEYTKVDFIINLNVVFEKFLLAGDTNLIKHDGTCDNIGCHNSKGQGIKFVGNFSKNYLDLIIFVEKGIVVDFAECRSLICKSKKFKSRSNFNQRLTINPDGGMSF